MTSPRNPFNHELPHAEDSKQVIEDLKRMSAHEGRQLLRRTRIITADGELAEPYRYSAERDRRHA